MVFFYWLSMLLFAIAFAVVLTSMYEAKPDQED